MASVGFAPITFLWLVSLLILTSTVSGDTYIRLPAVKHVALFVFGDSLYDPGNNNFINTIPEYQANFPPYGKTFSSFPPGRFSDGRLIPDFISEYARLPLIPPYLKPGITNYAYGVNFASGGAGALVETHQGFVVDLHAQVSYFKKVKKQLCQTLGPSKAQKLISKAVFLFSVGSNDYMSRYKKESVGMVLGNLTQVLQELYDIGGRKFGFVNIPPIGCLPGIKMLKPENNGACFDEFTSLSKLHNLLLPKVLRNIQIELDGFNYTTFDFFTSVSKIMDHPSKYGFKYASTACCGSGPYRGVYSCGGKRGETEFELCDDVGDYFFFDSLHPSEKACKQLSQMFWTGGPDVTWPYNLEEFFKF